MLLEQFLRRANLTQDAFGATHTKEVRVIWDAFRATPTMKGAPTVSKQ